MEYHTSKIPTGSLIYISSFSLLPFFDYLRISVAPKIWVNTEITGRPYGTIYRDTTEISIMAEVFTLDKSFPKVLSLVVICSNSYRLYANLFKNRVVIYLAMNSIFILFIYLSSDSI